MRKLLLSLSLISGLIGLAACNGVQIPPCVIDGSCLPKPSATCPGVPTPTVAPTVGPTSTIAPTPTTSPAPTSTSTPAPTPSFQTELWFINGFSDCNPYPCDPTQPACAAQGYTIRHECRGDRTAWYLMPGYDLVPKGFGCDSEPNGPCRPSCTDPGCVAECNRCRNQDSAGTPCGHAPSCDDHIACYRNYIGCSCPSLGETDCQRWDAANPSPGSQLSATGISCTDLDGFSFICSGLPGAQYTICTTPWPNAVAMNGKKIFGGTKHCVNGWF